DPRRGAEGELCGGYIGRDGVFNRDGHGGEVYMIRIGLLGCGTVAGYGHLPAIVATSGLQLAALFDPNRSDLDAAGEKFGVPAEKRYMEMARMFERGKLDAVTVTSPAPFHFENVMAAAERRCHVLCEKPLAENEADGRKMIDATKGAKKHLFVG